jgi:hypothetical protein
LFLNRTNTGRAILPNWIAGLWITYLESLKPNQISQNNEINLFLPYDKVYFE